jgi:hypothetical protein
MSGPCDYRPEHLRAFPETDPNFTDIQRPLRAAAESANRTIDDHLPRERLHDYGFATNHLSMPPWQAHRNAQTEAIFTHRHGPTAADRHSPGPAKKPSLKQPETTRDQPLQPAPINGVCDVHGVLGSKTQ